MATESIVKSACELCNQGCGVMVHLRNGKPVRVEGDPADPISRGTLCVKGAVSLDYLTNPQRLKYPLKRTGARGEGKWKQLSWDEALDTIAGKLTEFKTKYGAESVAFMRGAAKGHQDTYGARFANLFGSPNISSMSHLCHACRAYASNITYGSMLDPDYEYPPALMLIWASNSHNTAIGDWKRAGEALKKGAKLIVVDPWQSEFAREAQVWVKPRPGTDLALALGMINVIISENLYDREFVEKWTVGFDKLKEHVQSYSPEKVSEIAWVPAETIRQSARLYATTRPACLVWGNGIDNNINNFQTSRALAILRAITGNVGIPGGDIDRSPCGVLPKNSPELSQQSALPAEIRDKRLSAGDGMLPFNFYVLPQDIMKAVLTGKPYPIKAVFVQGANLLHTLPDANENLEALKKVEFLVVTDLFMTPTAELADLVLPVSMYLEVDSLHENEHLRTVNVIQKVAQTGECRSDSQIYAGLARRLGFGEYFWDTDKVLLDFLMKPAGLTFDEFRKVGRLSGVRLYRHYEKAGFNTPSKKVEIYSSKLAEWGFDPLPVYHEPPESPLSAPDLYKEYPFVLTNHKLPWFQHARDRYIEALRRHHPEPIVHIQSDTARKLGIKEGDWVYIETKRGKIKQRANLVPAIDPRVIIADYGWWFPEKDAASLHGWAESNINVLTCSDKPWGKEMGSPTARGMVCKVYKA